MKCAREGYPFIIICLISAILTWSATLVFGLWMSIIAILLSMLTILVAWFFRDPERDQLVDQDIIIIRRIIIIKMVVEDLLQLIILYQILNKV